MKKAVSLFLCLLMAFCFAATVCGASAQTSFTTASQLLDFVMVSKSYTTPVRLVPAVLTVDGKERDVWLVALLGMKDVGGQVNSSRGGGTDAYQALVRQVLLDTVPQGAALVFAGHSLGGMTAQLLRADPVLKDNYEIVNVLCGGSPLMDIDGEPEGTLHRLTDILDVIPYIRSISICAFVRQIRTAHRESGGYFLNPDGAHNLSYARDDVWGDYDVFGQKGGSAAIRFDAGKVQSFGAAAGKAKL